VIGVNPLYVGIDIGATHHVVQTMDPRGQLVSRAKVTNDLTGVEALVQQVVQAATRLGADAVHLGMEATNLYWWHLYQALTEHPALAPLHPQIAVLNPKVIHGFKGIYPDLAKTDNLDARVIADCLRFGRVRYTPPPDFRYAALQRLTRFRFHQAEALSREKNRALQLIFLRFSNYSHQCPFSDVFGKTSQAVLTELTTDQLAQAPLEQLMELMLQHGGPQLADLPAVAHKLQQLASKAYRLHPQLQDSVEVALTMSLETIRFFEQQLKKLDQVIARDVRAIPNTLRSVPGIGPVYEAGLLAEIGQVQRFPDHNALAKFIGLTWRQHQSSGVVAEDIPLSRSGNFYLRYYLIEAANSVRMREPEYAAYYQRKYDEARHHHHKRALVLTARKLVRLVFALLSEGQLYQPRRSIG
jgi:transposase